MTQFEAALRDELMAAARRPPRRRGEKVAVAAVLVAFVAGLTWLAVGSISSSPPAAADIHVSHKDGRVIVRLTDFKNTPEQIERATDKAGLDVRVRRAPAGPSNLGRFVGYVASEGAEDLHRAVDANGTTFVAFSLPEHWPGRLTLELGSPANPGEVYRAFSDAFAKGEPLACSGALGQPLRSIAARLDHDGATVVRFSAGGRPGRTLTLDQALHQGLSTLPITSALAISSNQIQIDVGGPPPVKPEPATC